MSFRVRNLATGLEHDVPAGHPALTDSRHELVTAPRQTADTGEDDAKHADTADEPLDAPGDPAENAVVDVTPEREPPKRRRGRSKRS